MTNQLCYDNDLVVLDTSAAPALDLWTHRPSHVQHLCSQHRSRVQHLWTSFAVANRICGHDAPASLKSTGLRTPDRRGAPRRHHRPAGHDRRDRRRDDTGPHTRLRRAAVRLSPGAAGEADRQRLHRGVQRSPPGGVPELALVSNACRRTKSWRLGADTIMRALQGADLAANFW